MMSYKYDSKTLFGAEIQDKVVQIEFLGYIHSWNKDHCS
jgi:hypothetical protein